MVRFIYHHLTTEAFMKLLKLGFAVVLAATTVAATAWSQSAGVGASPQILGYLNPMNNSFQPLGMPAIASPAALLPETVVTGKIVTNFTITIQSATITQATAISCEVTALVADPQNTISEEAAVLATRSTGKSTCTVAIPYSWHMTTAAMATDKVILNYTISSVPTTSQPGLLFRISSQEIGIIAVPKTGTTTTETVAATI
jgi:hypothetical protein